MKYNKPPISYKAQVERWVTRGLIIPDLDKALFCFQNISYYRLSAYALPFQETKDTFNANTHFDEVLNLYNFDRELRILVIDAIERIEVALRTQFIYKLSHKYGSHWQDIPAANTRGGEIKLEYDGRLPDILSYLQRETELTRATLVKIVTRSKRLKEFLINPQKYMDSICNIINRELHRLIIEGIKYEKLTTGQTEWSMQLLRDEELKDYFEKTLEVQKSIFDSIKYDSEIERKFAQDLDQREDVKLFVKLPSFFKVDTPIGTYNPDWAIVKHEDQTIYLVRETKSTLSFEKLRNNEADKVKCGRKHFEGIDVDFDVVTSVADLN